jgi:preprotein translocase subunit SecA
VLCSTINMTEILAQQLNSNRIRHEILNETQTRDEEDILRDAGLPRAVTIATNNAGRGTDIKLKGASKANGGLHVLITFFPETLRVEEQGRGRAGRQGEPGSSTIVLSAEALEIPTTADITTPVQQQLLLQQLDTLRKIRIYQMKTRHVCLAKLERFCFNYVREFYSKLKEFDARTKHPKFWDKCSRNLSFRILNIHKTDYRNLITQDKQIAEQACRLFQERPTEPLQWTLLLRKASLRLQEKIVYDWATQFLAYVDGLSQDSTLHSLNRFSNQLNLLNNPNNLLTQFLQQHINTAVETELNRLETAITQRYTQCTTQWEQLFDPTGKGVIDYLSKLIDVKLPNIC